MSDRAEITASINHTPKLVLRHHANKVVHGDSPIGLFNMRVAVMITKSIGSMWCAYAFAALALISLPSAIQSRNSIIIISWIAQTFLQLVLLPIIIVGQNVQAAASDARAESDHETLNSIHTLTAEVYKISERQFKILEMLEKRSEA